MSQKPIFSFGVGLFVGFLLFYVYFTKVGQNQVTKIGCDGEIAEESRDPAAIPNELSLLPPPKILASESRLKSNQFGEIYVQWDKVKDAKKYVATVTDEAGKVVRSVTLTKRSLYLRDLTPEKDKPETYYYISLASYNDRGFVGEPGAKEKLIMFPFKDLTAPKIKTIATED